MNVRWTSPALRQLRAAETFLLDRDRGAAARIVGRIDAATARLGRMPNIGRPARDRAVRELSVLGTRYIVVYEIRHEEIVILALFHERQQLLTSPTRDA